MDKRSFIKSLGIGLVAMPLFGKSEAMAVANQIQPLLKGKVLKTGDTSGSIAHDSAVTGEDHIAQARVVMEDFGIKAKEGKYIRERYGNLAGTDDQRLEDLHAMFADKSVAGILCIPGGA